MNFTQPQIMPLCDRAKRFGVKCMMYGVPGMAKTPILTTAPNGLFVAVEKGIKSARHSSMPSVEVEDAAQVENFFNWWFQSNEAKAFDSLCIDSASEIADKFLDRALGKGSNAGNKAHGQQAYGAMANDFLQIFVQLKMQEQKHIFMTAKEMLDVTPHRPYFLGKVLPVQVPHDIDELYHVEKTRIPGMAEEVIALRTQGDIMTMARSRDGRLDQFEQPDLTNIVNKIMN